MNGDQYTFIKDGYTRGGGRFREAHAMFRVIQAMKKSKFKGCWAGRHVACCCLRKASLEWHLNKNKK